MKCKLFFFLLLIPFLGLAQKIDFKEIEKNLNNQKSNYNYDRLIFKFKGMPKSLDSIEAQHVYYGRSFRNQNNLILDSDFEQFADLYKKGDFVECIKKGKALYAKDPTNIDVILILLRAYDQTKNAKEFAHYLSQLRVLTQVIRTSGDGKSEKTPFIVNSVRDESIFLNILNVGQGYSRHSTPYEDSVIDVWTKDNNNIYIKVLYMNF